MDHDLPKLDAQGSYLAATEAETAALATALAPVLRAGDCLALHGDLGAGKTAFARALINALPRPDGRIESEEVPSPTFTLVQMYDRRAAEVWHVDLYRLERPEDAWELGLEDALAEAITLIEWPERLGGLLPGDALHVRIEQDGGARRVCFSGSGDWAARLDAVGLRAAR